MRYDAAADASSLLAQAGRHWCTLLMNSEFLQKQSLSAESLHSDTWSHVFKHLGRTPGQLGSG